MSVQRRKRLLIEAAADYTGHSVPILRNAHRRGELAAERPSGFERGRLMFDPNELDRWMDSIKVSAK